MEECENTARLESGRPLGALAKRQREKKENERRRMTTGNVGVPADGSRRRFEGGRGRKGIERRAKSDKTRARVFKGVGVSCILENKEKRIRNAEKGLLQRAADVAGPEAHQKGEKKNKGAPKARADP